MGTSDSFHCDIFKTASNILQQPSVDKEDIVPEHETRAAAAENPNNNFCNFHGYLLKGDLETAMEVNCKKFKHIITSLIEALKTQLQPLLENDVFKVIHIILDSESYKFLDADIIYDEVKVIVEHSKDLFLTNNCCIDHLKEELEIVFDHINRCLSKSSAEKCWPIIFHIGDDLGIRNLLHILEICLVAHYPMESQRESSHFCGIFFQKNVKQRKVWRCC